MRPHECPTLRSAAAQVRPCGRQKSLPGGFGEAPVKGTAGPAGRANVWGMVESWSMGLVDFGIIGLMRRVGEF